MKKSIILYRDVLLLTLIAVPIGAVVGMVDALFGHVLLWITGIRMEYTYWLIPFLGIVGIVIIFCYQKLGGRSSKGMALIFEAGHGISDNIPFRLIPFTITGTWLTHLFGGSAGREGVAIQIGGTIAHKFGRYLPIKNSKKLLLITGMAAGFAGLFRTPIAATFFAIEVLTVGVLEHEAILPALTASFTASYVSGLLGLEKFQFILTDKIAFSWTLVSQILLIGILFGAIGGLFSLCLYKTKNLFAKWIQNPLLRIFVVGIIISCLSLLCWNGRYSGLGTNLISMSFSEGVYSWDFALKLIFTVLTLSAGFQGGEVTPLFSIGASLGVVLASLLGLPTAFVAALGYAAVFGSATNTLIAPMIIGTEIFGFEYLPYFVVVCTLAYVCNGNLSIYPLQKRKDDRIAMKTIKLHDLKGELHFTGQLRRGAYCGFFELEPGEYQVKINVLEGKLSLNHSSFNCDGGTYSCPPVKQEPRFRLSANESFEHRIVIGESFGHADRLDIVNPSMTKPMVCCYEICKAQSSVSQSGL